MPAKRLLWIAVVMLGTLGSLAGPAVSGADQSRSASAADDADAAPAPESGTPDPLAPKRVDGPAPLAPGAPAPQAAEAAAATEADAIVTATRARLAALNPGRFGGSREDLAAAQAFYGEQHQPIWTGKDGFTEGARRAIDAIGKADDWGLQASAFELPVLPAPPFSPESLAEAEAKLSLAVLKYARYARGGRFDPASISRKFDQKPVLFEPKSVLRALAVTAAADTYLQGLHPKHPQFERLRQALLAARGAPDAGNRKQAATIRQIVVNMERWRWMPPDLGPFYVWDSIPSQMTSVIENGKELMSEKIVVGKLSSPTPIFSADMQFIIFQPSWGVPPGMKSAELAPQLRDTGGGWFSTKPLASSVLRAHGLQVTRAGVPVDPDSVEWSSVDINNYEFTQGPGPTNVLGAVKFRFPNSHDVYMHDTPERNLFGGTVRAFSHGCMRVQNPMHLADVLLAHDKGWTPDAVREQSRRGSEVTLTKPIPVHITYFTLAVDDSGTLTSKPDVYGLDGRLASAIEGREVEVTSSSAPQNPPAQRFAHGPRPKPKQRVRTAADEQPFNPFSALFGD